MGRGASAIHGAAIRAHGRGLAPPCGFVESVGRKQSQRGHLALSIIPTELDVRPSALPAATAGARLGAALCLRAPGAGGLSLELLAPTVVWRNSAAGAEGHGSRNHPRRRPVGTVLSFATITRTAAD